MYVFFFKQKTAYEMRISDWSSDVCSSDLHGEEIAGRQAGPQIDGRQAEQLRHLAVEAHQAGTGIPDGKAFADRVQRGQQQRLFVEPASTRRSEERRVGEAGVSTVEYRWSASH